MTQLTAELFAIWSALLRDRLGLSYTRDNRDALADRLTARAQEAGFDSLLDYYYFLRYDDHDRVELAALAEALVINESYFFREPLALQVIADQIVGPAIARGARPRVWSAACAAGEEPLGLAMLLEARGLLAATTLVASDLSGRALARAHAGAWSPRALRTVPPMAAPLVERHLRADERGVRLATDLGRAIDWRRINLVDERAVAAVGPCDAILCRNVLIYFDDETVRRVLALLERQLAPNGALFVGVSESLLRHPTTLRCEEHAGVFLYRKVAP